MIHGKQKINQNTIYLMIKTLKSRAKNFEKILNSFLTLRRGYSSKKITVVKKIINDVEKYGDKSLIRYEKRLIV